MSRAEQLIYQRRAQEQKLSSMQTKLKQEFHHQEFAKWQNKGKNLEIQNQLKARLNQARAESQASLQARRQKLAQLLQEQSNLYQQQIIASQQTPEQIRQKMAARVQELKAEKQMRRKDEVNAKLDKRFVQNADELRKVDQELKELRTAYERNIQMVEKQNEMQNSYEEEIIFAELNRRDLKKKEEAERLKEQQNKEKLNERNAILAIQKEMKQRKAEEEKFMNNKEKQMLRQEWEKQSELEKLKEQQALERRKGINNDLIESNERQRREKEERIRLEKLQDKEMINRIMAKERELAERELEMKEHEKQEARRILQGLKSRADGAAAYEKELDRLIEEERLKRERKQDEEWEKKERARINLLHQVFDDREKKLRKHMAERDEQKLNKDKEKQEVLQKTKEYEAELERRRQLDYERSKVEQRKLLEEIADKEERRRMILQELHREEQELEAARQDYERKIQDRKKQGIQQLETFKKTNRLF